ncbi:sulfate permease [Malaciobacter molluscorum LMG 25693]|uniref:Sulfate permease n=1 Tax=Malaciobacter molluscorum LMG 25693 TaxID=870501 RepID=A0A2G1DKS3_9BACT|nr:SulP family inorganic anion transporter [Malaciobacter molluscorum]AXX92684.1 sulfate permease [Malaciobacter molluscorum LMG 25693]PHO19102.1 sulfate permease [Malaciobacter molluscorum LMG 25693]
MSNLKGDFFGGLTAAIIALPLALAFGVASGAGAVAGLYGAIVLGFFASLFGGTSSQISGPTGPMTVVMASTITVFHNDLKAVMCVVFLSGVFQILFGVLKIGKFVRYIPYPVISGFMSGIGIIIIILQINPFIGVDSQSSVIGTISHLSDTFSSINYKALFLSTFTLIIMLGTPKKIANVVPPALLALTTMTILSIVFNFDIKTIGEIPTSLPSFSFPSFDFSNGKDIIMLAITLALLGTIDTLLTSLVADSITKTKHNSNKELIGQGIGNTLVSLVGGIPGAGATMRTVINVKSGGRTKLSGIIHAIVLLLIVLFLAPIASKIPLAVLAGILMKVGLDILDYKFLKVARFAPKNDMIVMVIVFLLTVFVDLIMAVGVGITLASLLIVYRISKEANLKISLEKNIENKDVNQENSKIRVLDINGAFFFGSASFFEEEINKLLDTEKLIINCTNVPFMDISAIFTLEELILKLKDLGIDICLVLRKRHINKIEALDKTNIFKDVNIYEKLQEALDKE